MEFERYPMWMKHPHHRPAVISDDYEGGANRGAQFRHHAKPGTPEQFPAVLVNNADQEGYYEAKGYVAQGGDQKAFARATQAPLPKGYKHQEYPRMVNGLIEQDPNAPEPETNEYPKWVTPDGKDPVIVKSRAEEAEVMRGSSKHEPVKRETTAVEADCMAAIMAASEQRPPQTEAGTKFVEALVKRQDDFYYGDGAYSEGVKKDEAPYRMAALRLRAETAGVKFDKRWGEKRLLRAVEDAEKEAA